MNTIGPGWEVPYPRVTEIRRGWPGRASAGDRAIVRVDPGFIALLESRLADDETALGAGYEARWTVPFGLAATAAYAVAGASSPGAFWTGREVDIEWFAPAGPRDLLVAEAEIEAIDAGIAQVALTAETADGRPLLRARLRLAAVQDGQPLPSALRPQRRADEPATDPARPRPGYTYVVGVTQPPALLPGQSTRINLQLVNSTGTTADLTAEVLPPSGHGLGMEGPPRWNATLAPGATAIASFELRAQRPHEVNLGQPWRLQVAVSCGATQELVEIPVKVTDPRPGRMIYVLTEDCETFDGGPDTGDYADRATLGNHNNWMDPEDYRCQMIDKPARMNQIAERYGARWTHFFTVAQRFAVDWARRQSPTGAWDALARDLDTAVREGAAHHEYAPHLHCDYEPDSLLPPQPRLLYDPATDGILPNQYYDPETNPNHRFHDWDGAARGIANIKAQGDLHTLDSKTGSLFKAVHALARLQFGRRAPLIARIGSCDFGHEPEDRIASTRAFLACGLLGSSDAYLPWSDPPRGPQLFFCRADHHEREIDRLDEARLAQLCISFDTDFTDLDAADRWFDGAVRKAQGPGVRVVMAMTHAMFMRGEPDPFRSLDGGSFANLDRHLARVRREYPTVEMMTASEALVEYWDYYAPKLMAQTLPTPCAGDVARGHFEHPVRLLGAGIPVTPEQPATVTVMAPPWFDPADMESLHVVADGVVLGETKSFGVDALPHVEVALTTRPANLRLVVQLRLGAVAEAAACFERLSAPRFSEPPEEPRAPLFRLGATTTDTWPADLLALLMHPVAGHAEPLGRRMHPLGVFVLGVTLTAALAAAGRQESGRPRRLRLRWRHPVAFEATLRASTEALPDGRHRVVLSDQAGRVICTSEVELAASPEAEQPLALPADVHSPDQENDACAPAIAASPEAEKPEALAGDFQPPDPESRTSAPAVAMTDLAGRHARLVEAVQQFAEAQDRTLQVVHNLRGWKFMLFAQKAQVMARRGPIHLVRWLVRAATGRAELHTQEPALPLIRDYLPRE